MSRINFFQLLSIGFGWQLTLVCIANPPAIAQSVTPEELGDEASYSITLCLRYPFGATGGTPLRVQQFAQVGEPAQRNCFTATVLEAMAHGGNPQDRLASLFRAPPTLRDRLDIPNRVIEQSPTLQRWLKEVPDVLEDIRHDPSFTTRLRIGITTFPSTDDAVGINFGIEDIFIDRTGLTISTDYQAAFNGDRTAVGADLHYFLFPLGNYVNVAPLVGYRYVQSNDFNTDGLHLGLRLMLVFSRTGAGDISLSQSFISPGGNEEVGITSLSAGYAVTSQLRLSTDLEWQNSIENNDSRAGINLELLF